MPVVDLPMGRNRELPASQKIDPFDSDERHDQSPAFLFMGEVVDEGFVRQQATSHQDFYFETMMPLKFLLDRDQVLPFGGKHQISWGLFGLESDDPPTGGDELRSQRNGETSKGLIERREFAEPGKGHRPREGGAAGAFGVAFPVESEQPVIVFPIMMSLAVDGLPVRRISVEVRQQLLDRWSLN